MSADRDQDLVLEYLRDVRSYFQPYHAQKETMAWVATAASLGAPLAAHSLIGHADSAIIFRIVGMALATWFCWALASFMRNQLRLRTAAAEINAASWMLATRSISGQWRPDLVKAFQLNAAAAIPDFKLYLAESVQTTIAEFRQLRSLGSSETAIPHAIQIDRLLYAIVGLAWSSALIVLWT